MADPTPTISVSLGWDHALQFSGQAGRHEIGLDGASDAGPSPMQLMALSIAGCMAIDIVHILKKGRHALTSLRAAFSGERSPVEPRRFTRIVLHFTAGTDAGPEVVERAIRLSREKYCSVMNALREDIGVEIGYTIERP